MDLLPPVAGLLVALGGPPLVAFYGERLTSGTRSLTPHLFCQAVLMGLLVAILLIVLVWEGAPVSSRGLGYIGLSTVVWAAGIAALFIFLLGPVILRVPGWLGQPGFKKTLANLQRLPVWYLLLAVLVAGTVEELLYRGFAIDRLAQLVGSDWLAVALVSALFGLAHVPSWGWAPALTTMFSGIVLAVFYLWHRDIVANILAHIVIDFVGIVLPALLSKTKRTVS